MYYSFAKQEKNLFPRIFYLSRCIIPKETENIFYPFFRSVSSLFCQAKSFRISTRLAYAALIGWYLRFDEKRLLANTLFRKRHIKLAAACSSQE